MPKILVIDDDQSILDAISLILEDSGYVVETSLKGEETFKKISKFSPDVVLLDVLLSGLDGREICKKIKNSPETKKIPVIMISAHPTAAINFEQYGADAFLAKPFGLDELLDNVKRFVN